MSEPQELGKVEISDSVIGTISGVAVSAIEGIAGMRGTFIDGLKQATTGKKDFSAGVEVRRDQDGKKFQIDLYIIVDYNANVMEIAGRAQKAVKQKVEEITSIAVSAVNIHISDIRLPESFIEKPAEE
jgi:uncharacterized alkaline shock family protein YloU